MAIKTITIGDLAEHNYRSLDEIDRQVKEIEDEIDDQGALLERFEEQFAKTLETAGKVFTVDLKQDGTPTKKKSPHVIVDHVTKVVIPNIANLRKNFQIIDDLFDKVRQLKVLQTKTAMEFKGFQGMTKSIEGTALVIKKAEARIKAATQFLQKLADEHAPPEFLEFIGKVIEQVEEDVAYDDYSNQVYVSPTDDKGFKFTYYIQLKGLLDDEGNSHPELFLVFTCLLSPSSKDVDMMSIFVNVLDSFETPGKFDTGTPVDSVKAAVTVLGTLLELQNFSSALGTLPMNLDMKKITKNSFSVRGKIHSISSDERSLTFYLVSSVKARSDVDKIATQLYVELKAVMHHIKAKFRVRPDHELGRWKLTFTLTNVAGPSQISVNDMGWLKEKFGVEDDKLRKIVNVFNGG